MAVARTLARKAKNTIKSIATTKRENDPHRNKNTNDLPPRDWDSLALELHNRYGYLSHDFSVLEQVIEKTKAHSVLEVGCGSGRLVPVYLAQNIPTIMLQDISERSLDLCRQRFFCQEHIRYFYGDVQIIPTTESPDLIVANRVLQHILDDKKFDGMMNYLRSMARYFYINEAGTEQAKSINSPYLKGRDYAMIFCGLGWRVADRGELIAEFGTRQSWMLLTR
jgi:SAM-dependent methyltransferase